MTSDAVVFPQLRASLERLSSELIESILATWVGDWSRKPPRIGSHYTFWDIKALPEYPLAKSELAKIPQVATKYGGDSLDKPLVAFLELTVGSLPDPSLLPRAIDYWWPPFVAFLESSTVPIRLLVGLSNFEADLPEYRLDAETSVRFFGESSLAAEVSRSVHAPLPEPFPATAIPLHLVRGAIQVDFSRPADRPTLDYGHYSHECIDRMLPLKNALRLCAFGRLLVGPWLPICNPAFPVDGVRAINSADERMGFNEPVFRLDDPAWRRFQIIYSHLRQLQRADEKDEEKDRAIRRRFHSAISRFTDTFHQGYWESVVVDLVILMESLLTPNRQGGGMQIALAASNLLGDSPQAARELFDNVTAMYRLRNQSVHGEPSTQEAWNSRIVSIGRTAGASAVGLDDGLRE